MKAMTIVVVFDDDTKPEIADFVSHRLHDDGKAVITILLGDPRGKEAECDSCDKTFGISEEAEPVIEA